MPRVSPPQTPAKVVFQHACTGASDESFLSLPPFGDHFRSFLNVSKNVSKHVATVLSARRVLDGLVAYFE
jgi:hypothetical protein